MVRKTKVSFGMIVLNGMPFVPYCLRQIYPFAHEILVVEGATKNAMGVADENGHSTDGTVEAIREFIAKEDNEKKVVLIQNDGPWSEKDEQSQAYANWASGDYLWQVDVDEFYTQKDMNKVLDWLEKNPDIDGASFKMTTFWGGFGYVCDGWYLMSGNDLYKRLFKWRKGYEYATHRPPTVIDDQGKRAVDKNWRDGNWIKKNLGVKLFHYSLLFPKQVEQKAKYYELRFGKAFTSWYKNNYLKLSRPERVHNVFDTNQPSWLERFAGEHPEEINHLIADIEAGKTKVKMRENQDVEELLGDPGYKLKKLYWKARWGLGRLNAKLLGKADE